MITYITVTDADLNKLQAERVRALELDHARTCLVLAEATGRTEEPGLLAELAELERRISVHVRPVQPERPDADNPREHETSNGTVTTDDVPPA